MSRCAAEAGGSRTQGSQAWVAGGEYAAEAASQPALGGARRPPTCTGKREDIAIRARWVTEGVPL